MDALRNGPEAWTIQQEPDGTLRMRPTGRSARGAAVLLLLGLFACVVAGAVVFAARRSGGVGPPALALILFLPGAVLTGAGFWGIFVHEEWRVGPDVLEVQHRLFGYRRVCRYRAATLKLVHSTSVGYARRLLNEQMRVGAPPLPTEFKPGWLRLYVVEGCRKRCLRSVDDPRKGALRTLGEFVSKRTGWPLLLVRGEGGWHHGRRGRR